MRLVGAGSHRSRLYGTAWRPRIRSDRGGKRSTPADRGDIRTLRWTAGTCPRSWS